MPINIKQKISSLLVALTIILCLATAAPVFATSPSVSIGPLNPGNSVNVGTEVFFTATANNFSGGETYTVSDSFGGTTVSNSDFNSSGVFVWIPVTGDAGTHNLTVTVTDSLGVSASASVQIVVIGPPTVTIQSLSPSSSVTSGTNLSFSAVTSGFTNPVFTLSDSFFNSTVSNTMINSSGFFSWTPNQRDTGSHNISVYVNDSLGHNASVTQTITVTSSASLSIQSIFPSTSIVTGQNLSFTVVPTGLSNPTYTISDSFGGSSISSSNLDSAGNFNWKPVYGDSGTHTFTISASDSSSNSASVSLTVLVSGVSGTASITVSTPSPGTSVKQGTAVSFSTYTYGFTNPTFSLVDSFGSTSIANSNINSNGYFSWIPKTTDIGTHVIIVAANDLYGHSASSSTQIIVNNQTTSTTTTTTTNTSSSTIHIFAIYLYPGMTSSEVTALQKVLTKLGYFSGPQSGYFGPMTKASVIKLQKSHGLNPLGVVGPATRALLNQLQK